MEGEFFSFGALLTVPALIGFDHIVADDFAHLAFQFEHFLVELLVLVDEPLLVEGPLIQVIEAVLGHRRLSANGFYC